MQVSFICQMGRSGNCIRPNVKHFEVETLDQIRQCVKEVPFSFNIIQIDNKNYEAKTARDVTLVSQGQGRELDW